MRRKKRGFLCKEASSVRYDERCGLTVATFFDLFWSIGFRGKLFGGYVVGFLGFCDVDFGLWLGGFGFVGGLVDEGGDFRFDGS